MEGLEVAEEVGGVLLDGAFGGVVEVMELREEGGEGEGFGEEAPNLGAGVAEADAFAALEQHEDDLFAYAGLDGGSVAADERGRGDL